MPPKGCHWNGTFDSLRNWRSLNKKHMIDYAAIFRSAMGCWILFELEAKNFTDIWQNPRSSKSYHT